MSREDSLALGVGEVAEKEAPRQKGRTPLRPTPFIQLGNDQETKDDLVCDYRAFRDYCVSFWFMTHAEAEVLADMRLKRNLRKNSRETIHDVFGVTKGTYNGRQVSVDALFDGNTNKIERPRLDYAGVDVIALPVVLQAFEEDFAPSETWVKIVDLCRGFIRPSVGFICRSLGMTRTELVIALRSEGVRV